MRSGSASQIALGGVLVALAIVVMCLGGMIPIATFVCPVICMLIQQIVLLRCGGRIAWAWYGAVAILSLLLGPDKEAAAVFLFLGYYPIVKPRMDTWKLGWIAKLLLFNGSVFLIYGLLIRVFGMAQLLEEYREMGQLLTGLTLILGNISFFLVDFCLSRFANRRKHKRAVG